MATYTRPLTVTLLNSGLAGTLAYTIVSVAGSTLIARTISGITEDGTTSIYSANVSGWDTSWTGRIKWDDGTNTLAVEDFLADLTGGISASDIAAAVRANLATELGRIDVDMSSRLATSGYTNPSTPPTVVQIRQEMDSNSSKLALITGSVARESTLAAVASTLNSVGTLTVAIDEKTVDLNSIPTSLSGAPSEWTWPQWLMFGALRLARSSKDKVTGEFSVYASDQSTVAYVMPSSDTDDEETIGAPQ